MQYENSLNNVMAVGIVGKGVTMSDKTTSTVTGITFSEGVTYLQLANGGKVLMSDITDIYQPTNK